MCARVEVEVVLLGFNGLILHPNTLKGELQSCLGEMGMFASYFYYTQVQGRLLNTKKQFDALLHGRKGQRVYQEIKFIGKILRKLT